ncbi:MAG: hypothetical protein RL742_308 [Bacteroidota bacterium]|jgi:hypothetical protein
MKMKNKKAEQVAKKKAHREQQSAAKARRRGEPVLERQKPTRFQRQYILIVCQGKNTEPDYFRKFRLTSAVIKTFGGIKGTRALVERAQKLKEKDQYDQVWCVFDKDEFSNKDFNEAIKLAQNLGFGVAYSNQAFEYWLILHFEDHQGAALHRDLYGEKLNSYLNPLGSHYDATGSKTITDDIFDHLMAGDPKTGTPRVGLAIKRAKRIYERLNHTNPAKEESSTLVFRLVQEILTYV